MTVDFERVALLMGIVTNQPMFPNQPRIIAAAVEELNQIEADLKAEAEKQIRSGKHKPQAEPEAPTNPSPGPTLGRRHA